ncbi:hypothetical protein CRE_13271 [Caenorhabditis remanei]|uniref:Uncharacterized protein n=1 Tax=Caenorhabditis remanei TaxID=31234 RepID=E3M8E9_CAERE|nr:hypothetical protein CRE_13271 [Caenorhabditis remanei]
MTQVVFTLELMKPWYSIQLPCEPNCEICSWKDVVTAAPIGSMTGFVEEYKRGQQNKGCWLTNYVCGGPEKPLEKQSMRSRRSASRSGGSAKSCRTQASRKKSKEVNVCLEATPCGGSTIQT